MKKTDAVAALAALAQNNGLDVFRLPVEAGPDGLPAGGIARALKLAPSALSFHFERLRVAGLVTAQRNGRSIVYAANFETMNALLGFLTENCCKGRDVPHGIVRAEAFGACQNSRVVTKERSP